MKLKVLYCEGFVVVQTTEENIRYFENDEYPSLHAQSIAHHRRLQHAFNCDVLMAWFRPDGGWWYLAGDDRLVRAMNEGSGQDDKLNQGNWVDCILK